MRRVAAVMVFASLLAACGSGGDDARVGGDAGGGIAASTTAPPTGMIVDARVTDEALGTVVHDDGSVDQPAMDALTADVWSRPEDERQAILADLSLRTDLAAAAISGLDQAAGGRDALAAALVEAWAPVGAMAAAMAAPPKSTLRAAATSTPESSAATGLFMGYMALGMTAGVMVSGSDRMEPGEVQRPEPKDGMSLSASLESVGVGLQYKGTEKSGVQIEFTAKSELQVCPDADGALDLSALIDVKASKDGKGQNASVDLQLHVQVGDDAEAASTDGEARIQWADFANGKGQYLDMTSKGPLGVGSITVNRTGGAVTREFVQSSVVFGQLISSMILFQMSDAVERGWKSGRCVELNVTPSDGPKGLEPGQTVTVAAQPRSKIDGAPTGGTVTAQLTGGASSVDPSSTPLQADAEFSYTAPGEKDQTGTVSLEARSKRGVGKASVEFDTNQVRYRATFSGDGISISGIITSLTEPFDLDATFQGGTATFAHVPSSDTAGAVTVSGGGSGAVLTGGGTYTVTDNGDGTKTLTERGRACVDVSQICRDFTHPILLTPE